MKTITAKLNLRLAIIGLMLAAMLGYLIYGLEKLTVQETEAYAAAVSQTSQATTYQSGIRGNIVDRNGVLLAYDETTYNIVFYRDPTRTSPVESARYTQSLIKTIEVIENGGGEIIDTFYIHMNDDGTFYYDWGTTSQSVQATRRKNFVQACNFSDPDLTAEQAYLILRDSWQISDDMSYVQARKIMSIRQEAVLNSYRAFEGVTIAYDVPLSVVAELDMMTSELMGIQSEKSSTRIYPQGTTACHIVGYLGKQVTTNMEDISYDAQSYWEFFSEDELSTNMLDLGYSYSDLIGVAGVEKTMEAYLTSNITSRQGFRKFLINKRGGIIETLESQTATDGMTVQLTIDIELQKVVEQALVHNIEATHTKQENKLRNNLRHYQSLRDDVSTIKMAQTGAIVVLDCSNGDVLAMASYPNYDPNVFTDGINSMEFEELFGEGSNQPTLNRAIGIRTAPGSVFKMATGFSGLMEGGITTQSLISDHSPYYYFVNDPTTKVEQNAPSCWTSNPSRHLNLNLSRAITVSCNYFFFTVADRIGIDKLVYWSGQLGLEGTTGVELPGELSVVVGGQKARYDYTKSLSEQSSSMPRIIYNQILSHLKIIADGAEVEITEEQLTRCASRLLELQTGVQREMGDEIRKILQEEMNIPQGISLVHSSWIVPISTWLEELRWKPTYTIQTGIGQGVMLLTPVSVARYISTLANRGTAYQLHVVNAIYNADGSIYKNIESVAQSTIDAPEEYWTSILEGMKGVVSPEDGGTASSVFSKEFESKGYLDRIIGKTGTAQTSATNNVDIENTSWFVAALPRDNPEIVICVYIPNGQSGSSSAVAVEDIVTYWFERE
ncbi:MAG: penicillin-binding transpeptidase domain-containing protein [Eubacteriales bacterium]|nr:penicillin-binding transpeptidase domain-containing protein [Eubacteriales bacterium]